MSKTPVSLNNFFVFNSSFCDREDDEHRKLLYYYPDNVDINAKARSVGLCEALIKFTETFGSTSCEALHTQKTTQVFLQPEKEFWMVMTLNVPCQQKVRDGQPYMEYFSDEIQDHIYQSLLLKAYRMFTLINGTFHDIVEKEMDGILTLKKSLCQFFDSYLVSLKSNDADLLDIFQGIHFLPLERYSFLKILCFINQVEEKFRCIRYPIFLYNDQLVWSGLEPDDMQILYQHLSSDLIPSFIDSELKGGIYSPSRMSPMGSGMHFGRFMTGPKTIDDVSGLKNTPKIYLNGGKIGCYLISYRALNATFCLLLDDTFPLHLELFKSLDAEIGQQLSNLASEIGEQYSKTITNLNNEQQAKVMYMYFNHMNLAEKTTIHADMKKSGHSLVSSDIMKLFADVYSDLSKMKDFGEIMGKTVSDCWIAGKLSDERELYVVVQQKNANIVEVNEELKKLSTSQFQNIFIWD
ncbi:vacuolar fusion protein CCZ1 homolog [Uloborus diversus]|uniref:vacuolar fusion protein CCZ1 homolog n=1 Tax=Uloborus diversus TaxID=327109 RepID=UPI002409380C|nr:vacuolar fusion protein CCZ1 homolog [Uloborus diversus]